MDLQDTEDETLRAVPAYEDDPPIVIYRRVYNKVPIGDVATLKPAKGAAVTLRAGMSGYATPASQAGILQPRVYAVEERQAPQSGFVTLVVSFYQIRPYV